MLEQSAFTERKSWVLEAGAFPYARNYEGKTALDASRWNTSKDVFVVLTRWIEKHPLGARDPAGKYSTMEVIFGVTPYTSFAVWLLVLANLIAGFGISRIRYGFVSTAVATAVFLAFALLNPVVLFGAHLYVPASGELLTGAAKIYAVLFGTLIIAFGLRRLSIQQIRLWEFSLSPTTYK